jgi:hypothetical protein
MFRCAHLLFHHYRNNTTYAHSPGSWHLSHTLQQVGDGFRQGEWFFFALKNLIAKCSLQSVRIVIAIVLYRAPW